MLDTKETLILFGRSPFINKVKDKIPAIIDKYITMGCNYFCETFPDVDYVVFYDDIAPNVKDSTIVTQAKYFKHEEFAAAQKYPDYPKKDLYVVVKNSNVFADKPRVLYFNFHTPTMAMNWAWRKGFKNVVLIGIDLINHTPHFDKDTTPDINYPKWYDSDLEKAKRHISEVCGRYLNIYQVNPESDMAVEKITIDELLDDKLIIKKEERTTKMANVTIKLLTPVMINGQIATPTDQNNGIYAVTTQEANDLILRKRAVKYDVTIPATNKAKKDEVNDITELKKIADELGVKYNPNISAAKLEVRVYEELKAKAEEIGLTFDDNTPLKEAYDLYLEKKAEYDSENASGSGSDDAEKLSVEELKGIAEAAEIEISEDTADEDLQEFIEVELEQYAQELGLEVADNDNAKTLWEKIQEKLKENGN